MSRNRSPMSKDIMCYLGAVAFSWALEAPELASRLFPFIVLIRVGFFGILRPGEFLGLSVCDLEFGEDEQGCPSVTLAIAAPKTRRFGGRSQFSLITDLQTIKWLRWLCEGLPTAVRLWPSSSHVFSSTLRTVLHRGRLNDSRFSPASLCAGGAAEPISSGMEVGRLRFLGGVLEIRDHDDIICAGGYDSKGLGQA